MRTAIDLPDDLLIAAKTKAAETRTALREPVEQGLWRELRGAGGGQRTQRGRRETIRWVAARGGLPPGLRIADRQEDERPAAARWMSAFNTMPPTYARRAALTGHRTTRQSALCVPQFRSSIQPLVEPQRTEQQDSRAEDEQ